MAVTQSDAGDVWVYWDSTRHIWSVRRHGRVVVKAATVYLSGCAFRVSVAGRMRVRRTGRKTPHAFVVGRLDSVITRPPDWPRRTRRIMFGYNPFTTDFFQAAGSGLVLLYADHVCLDTAADCRPHCWAIGPYYAPGGDARVQPVEGSQGR